MSVVHRRADEIASRTTHVASFRRRFAFRFCSLQQTLDMLYAAREARSRKLIVAFVVFPLLSYLAQAANRVEFNENQLAGKYDLVSGRSSACPQNVQYTSPTGTGRFMPAQSMKAGGNLCSGLGGKALRSGNDLVGRGLNLPVLVSTDGVVFYVGVESSSRVCGQYAFNASAISWFFSTTTEEAVVDEATGIAVEPTFIYVTYSHFADLCVFRREIELPSETNFEDIVNPFPEEEAIADAVPDESKMNDDFDSGIAADGGGSDGGSECFPSEATVYLEDGSAKAMSDLQIGDRVLASVDGLHSDVYLFSHQDPSAVSTFVKLSTASGFSLSLTRGHILYINGRLKPAHQVKVGESVQLADGSLSVVRFVTYVTKSGLYSPQTLLGDIVVNGVLATTWTTAVDPTVANTLLVPARLMYRASAGNAPHCKSALSTVWRNVFNSLRFLAASLDTSA